ncbi:MAG: arylsulfatase [Phycisphaerae bacterium]|nr:arylsulfatase [Phycisphaerae bacterium]
MNNARTRRSFLKVAGLGAVALASPISLRAAEGQRKPNIIYIMADDLGYGDLSCYGQKKFTTPHLDKMRAEGMKFTDHYSGSTVCAPSRCVLMTGLHTGHAHVRGNRGVKPEGQAPMPADIFTVPRMLKKAGYVTGMFGKWGLGAPGSPSDPAEHFDEFFGYNCQGQAHTYYPGHLWRNRTKVRLDGKTYSADLIAEKGLEFIKANKDKPFFCYMPTTVPHASMHVPEDSHKQWREKFPQFEKKIGRYSGPKVTNPIAAFAGMVTRLDSSIGKLLALLKELKIDDNTLVIFTSDNGPHREGGHDPNFFNSNGPLKGIKRDLYEGGIRVPFIARWPGKVKAGSTTALPSAFWDFMPTCADIAGVQSPKGIDGLSYLPTLLGQDDKQKKHEYLYWEFFEGGGKDAVRMGKWKGVRTGTRRNPDAPLQLFDLDRDLGETRNVASDNPEMVKKLMGFIKAAHTESPLWPSKPKPRKKK